MNSFKEDLLVLAVMVVGIFGAIFGAVFSLAVVTHPLHKYSCESRWESSGYQSEYGFFSGCRVKVDGRWLPEEVVVDLLDNRSVENSK